MTDRFAGRRVAVTGAAGGIGLAICERLAAQGAQVHGLDLKGLDALPAAVTGHTVDVTSEESVTAVVRALYADDERPVDDTEHRDRRASGELLPGQDREHTTASATEGTAGEPRHTPHEAEDDEEREGDPQKEFRHACP